MPTLPAPTWGNLLFFPLAFESIGAGRGFNTLHLKNDHADRFIARQESGLWHFNLGDAKILPVHMNRWDAFVEASRGQWGKCLMRQSSSRFTIDKDQTGYDGNHCGIGTGDGIQTQFQLQKIRSYPAGPTNQTSERVRYPWHNYPEFRAPVGDGAGTVILPTEYVRIWVAGTEIPWLSGWDVDRETGVVVFDAPPANGALIQASCKFFVAVHGADQYSLVNEGSYFSFPAGAELLQAASDR